MECTETVTSPPRDSFSPPRSSIVGSISPEMTACAVAVCFRTASGSCRYCPRPATYSSTCACRDRSRCASASWITTWARPPVSSHRACAPPMWSMWPWVSRIQRTSSMRRPRASSAGAIPSAGDEAIPVSTIAGSGASMKKLYRPNRPHGETRGWIATCCVMSLTPVGSGRLKELGGLLEHPVELRDPGEVLDEPVVGARVAADRRLHSGFLQPRAVEFALVPHGVELGRDDQRRGQAGEILALDRGDARIRRVRTTVEVEGVEALQPGRLHAVPFGVLPQRGVAVDVEVQVQRGVEQHLVGDAVESLVVGHRGDGGDEGAARAVA